MEDNDKIEEYEYSSDEEFDDASENDTESSTDVDEKIKSEDIFDEEFLKCYSALKQKDSRIYDPETKFFNTQPESCSSEPKKSKSLEEKKPKLTVLDHQLSLGEEVIEPKREYHLIPSVSHYDRELNEIKESLKKVSADDSEDDDDFLIRKNDKRPVDAQDHTEMKIQALISGNCVDDLTTGIIKKTWTEPQKLSKEDRFLRDYIINKRYIPENEPDDKGGFFSTNLDDLSDIEEEKSVDNKKRDDELRFHFQEKGGSDITRIPRNATKTIRDLNEKLSKKEKRLKKLEKRKKAKKAIKNGDFEDIVGDIRTKFKYVETKPEDEGLSAEELLRSVMEASSEEDHDKPDLIDDETSLQEKKKKKKKKRGLNHKKFAKVGVAPDRLLAYGLSKNKLKKSKLL